MRLLFRRGLAVVLMAGMCLVLAACGNGSEGQRSWPVEALTAEEFTCYADNANVFADSVLESGAEFLYVQLACAADSSLSEEDIAVANDNADGICSMIENDYHDVLDARNDVDSLADAIADRLALTEDAKLLVIGDAAGEKLVYEGLAETYGNIDYLNAGVSGGDEYDEIYNRATVAGFDFVIVANDVCAFRDQSFPFSS